jgi:hypothetical protein
MNRCHSFVCVLIQSLQGKNIMQLLRTVKMVLWSFIGIRKRAGLEADVKSASPGHVIGVAVVLVAIFIGILLAIANAAVSA